MIDIHSHLLPNLDDGSTSTVQSVSVLERFALDGVTDVILTPHVQVAEMLSDPDDALERREVAYRMLLQEAPRTIRLHLGFEIMVNDTLPPSIIQEGRFALARSRYHLIEFYLSARNGSIVRAVHTVKEGGGIPVVAHAERYHVCSPETVREWRNHGGKIQVDATTLTRPGERGRRARQLVSEGLADLVAADNHGGPRRMRTAVEYLTLRGYRDVAEKLSTVNPGAVVANAAMVPVPPARVKERMWDRLKNMMGMSGS